MQLPRSASVLPSQRYSPASDYSYDHHHHHEGFPTTNTTSTRQPLSESTGNIQPHGLTAAAALWCSNSQQQQQQQHQLSLPSPSIHSTIPTPVLPTQTLGSSYGTSLRGGGERHHILQRNILSSLQHECNNSQRGLGSSSSRRNPIYHHKNFADYRNKVMQKELDKEQTVWPDWLEDAFLDALLLIPQLGRKKFSSKTILYGRNMLISEYLWIYHWTLHPPKKGEMVPSGKQREKTRNNRGHPMFRSRKQVSSHIQVLKGFFPTLSTFHFIFPRQKDGLDDERRLMREEDDTESFKHNRVLISIADGRLPDERPNYEYFSRLLNAENDVFVRPKQCWIFVSSSTVTIKEKQITASTGNGNGTAGTGAMKKQITAHHPDGLTLTESDYPHLKLNEGKDYKDLPRQGDNPTVLLHEYTRSLSQKESSSVRDISSKWDTRFPELRNKLTAALDAAQTSDERTSRCVVGPCDTFHFETVLDLHATSKFPSGSDLNGLVEFTICRPDLHGHVWRSKTSVIKPDELYMSEGETEYWDQSSSIDVIPAHRGGCPGIGRCDCTSRGSRDTISIPFPANSWANTFIKLAPYVTEERERRGRERATREAASLDGRAEREAARLKKENEESSHSKLKSPSPKDLLAQIAMYQEIWSAPQIEPANRTYGDDSNNNNNTSTKRTRGAWKRRAVILWTFVPVHEKTDDKGKTTTVSSGTNWRFLTKIDPTSSYHQQQAYVSGSTAAEAAAANAAAVSRDVVMSPNPGYAHHLNAAMQENFSAAAYDTTAFTLPSHPHIRSQQQQLTGLDAVLDGYAHGLETPPPTATFPNGYAQQQAAAYDGNGTNIEAAHTLHHHLSFISDGSSGTDHSLLGGSDHTNNHAAAEAFLSGLDGPEYHNISDFNSCSPAHAFGDLATRYIGATSHSGTDAVNVSWADSISSSGCHSLSATADPASSSSSSSAAVAAAAQWAVIAAQAQAHAQQHANHDDMSPGHHDAAWGSVGSWQQQQIADDCSPMSRQSSTSLSLGLWDESVPTTTAAVAAGTATDILQGGAGSDMKFPRSHGHNTQPSQTYPVLTSQSQSHTSPSLAGRKRSRTESVELDEDGDDHYRNHYQDYNDAEGDDYHREQKATIGRRDGYYPSHSMRRKLAHHHNHHSHPASVPVSLPISPSGSVGSEIVKVEADNEQQQQREEGEVGVGVYL